LAAFFAFSIIIVFLLFLTAASIQLCILDPNHPLRVFHHLLYHGNLAHEIVGFLWAAFLAAFLAFLADFLAFLASFGAAAFGAAAFGAAAFGVAAFGAAAFGAAAFGAAAFGAAAFGAATKAIDSVVFLLFLTAALIQFVILDPNHPLRVFH